MKKLWIVFFLLLAGAAVFYLLPGMQHTDGRNEQAAQTQAEPGKPHKPVAAGEVSSVEKTQQGQSAMMDESSVEAAPEGSARQPENTVSGMRNPFVQQGSELLAQEQEEPAATEAEQEPEDAARSVTEEDTAPRPSGSTPSVIPIEQAAQYFIPREQRSPGNLGGPPPLPTVNSAPAGGTPAALQPPAAPGEETRQQDDAPAPPAEQEQSGNASALTPPPAFN